MWRTLAFMASMACAIQAVSATCGLETTTGVAAMSNCAYEYSTLGSWPASFGDGTGLYTTAAASVAVTVGESAYFSVRTPSTSPRNRWIWQLNMTQPAAQKAFDGQWVLRSCATAAANCTDPRPTTMSPAFDSQFYDSLSNVAGTGPFTANTWFTPRYPTNSQRPFRTGSTPYYPQCTCLSDDNIDQSNLATESWWIRGAANAGTGEQGALVASTVSAFASVMDICAGHGTELPLGTQYQGCTCDAGYFGTQCILSIFPFRACCSDRIQPMISNSIYTFTNSSRSWLEQQLPNQLIYSYTSAVLPSAGTVYTASVRLKTLDTKCRASSTNHPRFYFTGICNSALQSQCAMDMAIIEDATFSATPWSDYSVKGVPDTAAWNAGRWQSLEWLPTTAPSRARCGCTSTIGQPLSEQSVLFKMMVGDAGCQYELALNSTAWCMNGGTYRYGQGCKCAEGFGGKRCENTCTSNRGGPNCNEYFATLISGSPHTWTSGVGNSSWFDFASNAPVAGNSQFLRIKVVGEDGARDKTILRVSAVERCSNGVDNCPVTSQTFDSGAQTYGSGISLSNWPNDFNAYSSAWSSPPMAWATFVTQGSASPLVTGWGAKGAHNQCGCMGLNRTLSNYDERWHILVKHRSGPRPTNALTITVDSLDVCNGHGFWNEAAGTCTCNAGYTRGQSNSNCGAANAFIMACCQTHTFDIPTVELSNLDPAADVYQKLQVTTAPGFSMPVTQTRGAQIQGKLPTAQLSLFPNERANIRWANLPKNPAGNPWMFTTRTALVLQGGGLPQTVVAPVFLAGVHTCSATALCNAMHPDSWLTPAYTGSQWPSQWVSAKAPINTQPISMPYEVGSHRRIAILEQGMDKATLDVQWNPIQYWNNTAFLYDDITIYNNVTTYDQQCACTPEYYELQSGTVGTVQSDESWNWRSSQFWGPVANMMTMSGEFYDPCSGHGIYRDSAYSCQCATDYYGAACDNPSLPVPSATSNFPTGYSPVPQPCCTSKMYRGVDSLLRPAADIGSVSPPEWLVEVTMLRDVVFKSSAPSASIYTRVGMAAYSISNSWQQLGYNFQFTFASLVPAGTSWNPNNPLCYDYEYDQGAYFVCGDWTVEQCAAWLMSNNPGSSDLSGSSASRTSYRRFCGCGQGAFEHAVVILFRSTNTRNIDCRATVTVAPMTTTCLAGRSTWDFTVHSCVCPLGFANPPLCDVDMTASSASVTFSGYGDGTKSYQTAQLTVAAAKMAFFKVAIGEAPDALNLALSSKCPIAGQTTTARRFRAELYRCYNISSWTATYDRSSVGQSLYTPEQTFAFLTGFEAYAATTGSTLSNYVYLGTDNGLRHCDYVTLPYMYPSEQATVLKNAPGTYTANDITIIGLNSQNTQSTSTNRMYSYGNSPCSTAGANFDYNACFTSPVYFMLGVYNTHSSDCQFNVTQTSGMGCSDSFMQCSAHSQAGGQCLPGDAATNTYAGVPVTGSKPAGFTCGACSPGFEGVGCYVPIESTTEIFNLDSDTFPSIAGERVRMSIQLSPSNDPIKFKFTIAPSVRGEEVIQTSCGSTCTGRRSPVWIRARLGRFPPTLVTRVVSDEAYKIFYIDSTGQDEEANATATAQAAGTSTAGNGDPLFGDPTSSSSSSSSSSTGAAFRRLLGLFEQEEDGSLTSLSAQDDEYYSPVNAARRLLSTTVPVNAIEEAFPVLRWDQYVVNGSVEFSLLSDANFRVSRNDYLYIDVYHGVIMTGYTDNPQFTGSTSNYKFTNQDSGLTTTNVGVEVSISDPLGNLVGFIAAGILLGFTFFLLVYLIVIRCKYGSISRGIEVTVLGHAVVEKGGKKVVDEKKLAKEKKRKLDELKRRQMKARGEKHEEESGCCGRVFKTIGLVLAFVLLLTFELLKVLFNISILHSSVGSYVDVVDYQKVHDSVEAALNQYGLDKFVGVFERFSSFFSWLGIFNQVSLRWNCGGALSMFSPVVILIGSIVLIVILQKDYFLRFALSMRGSHEGTAKAIRKAKAAMATVLATIVLYILQSSIMVLSQVVASTWNIKRNCSQQDKSLVRVGRILCIIMIVLLFYFAGLLFAGIKSINKRTMIIGWFTGLFALLKLSFGIWSPGTVRRFDIRSRAAEFDTDENRDRNPEESVMELQGASRGLMWVAFPLGIILTKVTEQINAPPFLIWGPVGSLGVQITTPRWNRGLLWLVGMLKMAGVFLVAYSANERVAVITFGLVVLWVFLLLALPDHYYRDHWMEAHPDKQLEIELAQLDTQKAKAKADAIEAKRLEQEARAAAKIKKVAPMAVPADTHFFQPSKSPASGVGSPSGGVTRPTASPLAASPSSYPPGTIVDEHGFQTAPVQPVSSPVRSSSPMPPRGYTSNPTPNAYSPNHLSPSPAHRANSPSYSNNPNVVPQQWQQQQQQSSSPPAPQQFTPQQYAQPQSFQPQQYAPAPQPYGQQFAQPQYDPNYPPPPQQYDPQFAPQPVYAPQQGYASPPPNSYGGSPPQDGWHQ